MDVYNIEIVQPKTNDTREVVKQGIEERAMHTDIAMMKCFEEIQKKVQRLNEFIKSEKRSFLSKEMEKKYCFQDLHTEGFATSIPLFIVPLRYIKRRSAETEGELMKYIH